VSTLHTQPRVGNTIKRIDIISNLQAKNLNTKQMQRIHFNSSMSQNSPSCHWSSRNSELAPKRYEEWDSIEHINTFNAG